MRKINNPKENSDQKSKTNLTQIKYNKNKFRKTKMFFDENGNFT